MSKSSQISKNIKLSSKLAEYLASSEFTNTVTISNASFVPFSATDLALNKENKKIVRELQKEGTKVIEAKETKSLNNPWKFNFV